MDEMPVAQYPSDALARPRARRAGPRSPLLVRRDLLAPDPRADRAPAHAPPRRPVRADPDGVELPVADTAAALGLGPREGQNSPLIEASAGSASSSSRAPRTTPRSRCAGRCPPVAPPSRAPAAGRGPGPHAEWISGQAGAPVELARRRARRVALTLVVQGEPIDTVERALHSGGFHPSLAHEAVRWARRAPTRARRRHQRPDPQRSIVMDSA